ncbi:unnamed protein product [Porites lobata]|uniref:Succinate dehydrogenase assembly factor 3 n=1 Tax=Porites lobata TaxID=104759 RepID=A0ABN8Q026_9CNID|nr:unnamed protein product [Porites lobata]
MNSTVRLYRRILKLHRKLPLASRALGDQYLKDEFRRHKNATREQLAEFIQEWKIYADMLEGQQKEGNDFGSHMSEDQVSNIREEQLLQLYALHQEINSPPEGVDSAEKR